jgi:ubiquinone/menaquinone biosynthesis C-methylase UbiE
MSIRVDYDLIAPYYDDRRRDHAADARLSAYLASRGLPSAGARVLDIGCGTGKQLAADRCHFPGMRLVGVDFSAGMLRVARERDAAVAWIQGDAQALPLASGSFDYATNQFSYPHIADKRAFAGEVFRVLRPGGRFVLTNIDPWAMDGWALYRYFPEARALDARDFLRPAGLASLLAAAGFTAIDVATDSRSESHELRALLASASKRHSASQLIAIPDAAYRAGLLRMRDDVARGITAVESAFAVLTIQADRPA